MIRKAVFEKMRFVWLNELKKLIRVIRYRFNELKKLDSNDSLNQKTWFKQFNLESLNQKSRFDWFNESKNSDSSDSITSLGIEKSYSDDSKLILGMLNVDSNYS